MLIIEEIGRLAEIFDGGADFTIQSVIQLLLCLSALAEETVIVVAVFGRVDTDKVASPLVFQHCLNNDLFHPRW